MTQFSIHNRFAIVLLSAMLCLFSTASGQSQALIDTVESLSGIEVRTTVDRAEMYVGDLITYSVTIIYDSTLTLIPPPLGANLGAFDVKDYQTDIITTLKDGRRQSENIFKLSTFTVGDYIIPPLPVIFELPEGGRKLLLSEAVPITVKSLLLNVDDSIDIKPLKAQYEFKRDMTPYYLWGGLGALLLIGLGFYLWRRFRKKEDQDEPVDLRPPWEIAFEKLAILRERHLPSEQNYKLHYIELTEIVREFFGKVYSVNVLDMTTEEFLASFKEIRLPETVYDRAEIFLKHADLVKFAKMIPVESRSEADLDEAHTLVDLVRSRIQSVPVAESVIDTGEAVT